MPLIDPPQPSQALDAFNQFTNPGPSTYEGFAGSAVPSTTGTGTRQSKIRNNRPGITVRNRMYWFVPEQPIVEMYINPQRISISDQKSITQTRTKGGYSLQYWGEELTKITINGTTGTSGIEGINVLRDVYRSEQLAIDPYALYVSAQPPPSAAASVGSAIGGALGGDVGSAIGGAIGGLVGDAASSLNPSSKPLPSLAQFAFSVELYWCGEIYRGYFSSFSVDETVDSLGLFSYNMEFNATQKRGFRQNFMPWHRSAVSGPSDSNPFTGRPYSYGSLVPGDQATPRVNGNNSNVLDSIGDSLGFDLF